MIREPRIRTRGLAPIATLLTAALLVISACGGTATTTEPASAADTAATTPAPATPAPATTAPAGAASPDVVTMHIAVAGDACTYDGPMSMPYGPFDIAFDVSPSESDLYFLLVVTLAEGKTGADVTAAFEGTDESAAPSTEATPGPDEVDIPSWITRLATFGMRTPGTSEVMHQNLSFMGAYTDGPIWVLCFRPERMLGTFGPIEVTSS